MKHYLVGFNGFVGSNLSESSYFTDRFNSSNITEAYNQSPDLLVYAGVRGTKYLANNNPKTDYEVIENAIKNITNINAKKIVLISTIDVFNHPDGIDEDYIPTEDGLSAYGIHRMFLENWVKSNCKDYSIIRLPGIYGKNLKKNYIYDLIHKIPPTLSEDLLSSLDDNKFLLNFYQLENDGYYHCINLNPEQKNSLLLFFEQKRFSSLNLTDSRGVYQYYNLAFLLDHIKLAIQHNLPILNIATEPFSISELFYYIFKKDFKNFLLGTPAYYNMKTKYSFYFGKDNGYIFDKEFILKNIKSFVESEVDKI